jgi:hypothetical protein
MEERREAFGVQRLAFGVRGSGFYVWAFEREMAGVYLCSANSRKREGGDTPLAPLNAER